MCLQNLKAAFGCSVARYGIFAGQLCEELVVARELEQILASLLHADRPTDIHAVGVDERKVVSPVNIVEEHIARREIAMQETAETVNAVKRAGGRVIAVGTTSCRTLESFTTEDGTLQATSGWTNIFIYPGYKFKCIDALITNFHLPESTLIMLVSALAGREHILNAYNTAVKQRYRFFSFGDAMFIE